MVELLIYFVIATVVCVMLYMVLGKQVGEAPDTPFVDQVFGNDPNAPAPEVERGSPHFDGDAGEGLTLIASKVSGFHPNDFIDSAKAAYGMILEGYADGDMETLEMLVSAEMFAAYKAAIEDREAQSLTQTTDLARIISAKFVEASCGIETAAISVAYEADIASALMNASGDVVQGDIETLGRVSEIWTYERNIKSKSSDWALVSVVENGDDTLGSAPDFNPDA